MTDSKAWKPPSQKQLQDILREHKSAGEAGNGYVYLPGCLRLQSCGLGDDSVYVYDNATQRLVGSFMHKYEAEAAIKKAADVVSSEREGGASNPANWTASKINAALDSLDKKMSKVTDKFIAAGRGHERPSDYRHLTDPLSLENRAIQEQQDTLHREIYMRMGPGAPSRIPAKDTRMFGPRKVQY